MTLTKLAGQSGMRFIALLALSALLMTTIPANLSAEDIAPQAVLPLQEGDITESDIQETTQEGSVIPEARFTFVSDTNNKNNSNDPQIKICHANNHGYDNGKKEVDEDSIIRDRGHGAHDDGGYNNQGDIIPPFDVDGNPFPYEKNWVEPFISIWENNCDFEGDITVTKVVVGGTAKVKDFTLSVGTTEVKSGKKNDFEFGTYLVTENGPLGYTATFSDDCADGEITLKPGESIDCTITNTFNEPEYSQSSYYSQSTYYSQGSYNPTDEVATIYATKIVCTDEDDLPNWGNGGPNISTTTAADWVASHDSCELKDGWEFEWAGEDVFDPRTTTTGSAGAGWNAFDTQTNSNGVAKVELTAAEIGNNSYVWVRELLKPGYIPFTWSESDGNSNDESAELYCATDVLNYDNFDRVDTIEVGETYHCVAWNVPKDDPGYSQGTYYAQGSYDGYSQGSYGGPPQTGVLEIIKIVSGTTTSPSNFSFNIDKIGTVVGDITNEYFEADGTNVFDFTTGVFTITENVAAGYVTTYSNSFNADADCELLLVIPHATTTCTITNTVLGGGPGYSQGSYNGYSQGSYGGGYSQSTYYSQGSYGEYSQGSYGGGYSQGSYGGGSGYSQGSYSSGGGGNGIRIELRDSGGSSNGGNDSDDEPQGQVLGLQTTAFPAGAPNTGKGGTSASTLLTPYLMGIPSRKEE